MDGCDGVLRIRGRWSPSDRGWLAMSRLSLGSGKERASTHAAALASEAGAADAVSAGSARYLMPIDEKGMG